MPEAAHQIPVEAGTAQEPASVDARTIGWVGLAFAAMVIVCFGLVTLFYWWRLGVLPTAGPHLSPAAEFPAPELQVHPPVDLSKLRLEEARQLSTLAAMPIDRAMAVIANRQADAFAPLVLPRPANEEAKP